MTCTKCGDQSKKYNKDRIKQCKCGYKIVRDCNWITKYIIEMFKKFNSCMITENTNHR